MEYIFALCRYLTMPEFVLQYQSLALTLRKKVQLCCWNYILLQLLLIISRKLVEYEENSLLLKPSLGGR